MPVRVVVTFCNQRSTPRLAVCAVDLETGDRAWLDVPDDFAKGAAGIAPAGDGLLVACQDGGVVAYDAELKPRATIPTPSAGNLHSMLYQAREHALYVTSAHNDTLFRYELDDSATALVGHDAVFCADPSRRGQDRYHLNSVVEWRGELYVTMFGVATGEAHTTRRNGAVVRVRDGEAIATGLYHPHTLFVMNDELFVIESQAHAVRRVAGGEPATWTVPYGYPRGVVATSDRTIWVGVSAMRRESNSLGTPNVIASRSPLDFRTRLVELDLATGDIGRTIDLTLLAGEIFDIHPLPSGAPFTPDEEGGLPQRVEALEASFGELRAANRVLEKERERAPWARVRQLSRRVRRRIEGAVVARRAQSRRRDDGEAPR